MVNYIVFHFYFIMNYVFKLCKQLSIGNVSLSKWCCKTQNSGLRSKEEKPRDPINQPSRCNTQEGLLSVAQMGDSDLLGGSRLRKRVTLISWEAEHPEQQIKRAFYMQKTMLSAYYIRVTRWLVTRLQSSPFGTNFSGLHVYKAILLAQTSRAFVQN